MAPLINIKGLRTGRLTVLGRSDRASVKPMWDCACDCGRTKAIMGSDLRASRVASCGCLRDERVRSAIQTHGDAPRSGKRPEYNVWLAMRDRCSNPDNKDYRHYGGRGIKVCEAWDSSYAAFIADMGYRPTPKHTIDRIEVNGGYEPGNCRWATWSEQRRNTRRYLEVRTNA